MSADYRQQEMMEHLQQEIEAIILKAMKEPISADDARLMAYASGITLPKEFPNGTLRTR